MTSLLSWADRAAAAAIAPLAAWILLSGLDDLVVLGAWLAAGRRRPPPPAAEEAQRRPEMRIAVFVPCWREERVIREMVHHNISAIRYGNYDIFLGAYPNDDRTIDAGRELESTYARVHLCLCPHDGPTSKADCLNWIYQRMLLFEEEQGGRFDLVVIHDAEDLVHPDELKWMDRYAGSCEMIQVPVLPLATPPGDLTHGLYCDDFAEAHTKDLPARQVLGGFIPSCGVGTGYARAALERLAAAESNRIFEPDCLTEDYENGFRLRRMGARQIFLPLRSGDGPPLATREFFPRRFREAVRQRTRWVAGIALQTWRRHGWSGGPRQTYWWWRDRKGLIGSPVSVASNLLFLYGLATWCLARPLGTPWGLGDAISDRHLPLLLAASMALQTVHLAVRAACAARFYGGWFALGVPVRVFWGNWVNAASTLGALWWYARASYRGEPLVWVKTEHAYPSRATLLPHKRPLEEILVGSGYLSETSLASAHASKPPGVPLAEHLVHAGLLSEDDLYEALSLQLGLALGRFEPADVPRNVARALPARVVREWNVLPVKIAEGSLHLASPDPPTDELHAALRRFTPLEIQVQLVTPANFRRLAEALL